MWMTNVSFRICKLSMFVICNGPIYRGCQHLMLMDKYWFTIFPTFYVYGLESFRFIDASKTKLLWNIFISRVCQVTGQFIVENTFQCSLAVLSASLQSDKICKRSKLI